MRRLASFLKSVMGCVQSSLDREQVIHSAHVLEATLIYDGNSKGVEGHAEINCTHVLFHPKNKEDSISWPLTEIKTYGYHDKSVFKFECGRRSPCGAGVFSFKTRHATMLFCLMSKKMEMRNANCERATMYPDNEVQSLVRSVPDQYRRPINTANLPDFVTSLPADYVSVIGGSEVFPSSLNDPHSVVSQTNSGMARSSQIPEHRISTVSRTMSHPERKTFEVPDYFFLHNGNSCKYFTNKDSSLMTRNRSLRLSPSSPLYGNFPSRRSSSCQHSNHTTAKSDSPRFQITQSRPSQKDKNAEEVVYTNINGRDCINFGLDRSPYLYSDTSLPFSGPRSPPTTVPPHPPLPPIQNVNYIIVDVDKGSDSSQLPPFSPTQSMASTLPPESPPITLSISSSNGLPMSAEPSSRYTIIDADRTAALLKITKEKKFCLNYNGSNCRHNSMVGNASCRHNSTASTIQSEYSPT